MREIKFRAWGGKRMEDFDLQDLYWRGEETGEYDFPGDKIVMQYTGLLDKNGVEIYEGDIVKYCLAWGRVDEDAVADEDNWHHGEVRWNQSSSGFNPFVDVHSDAAIGEVEVIGNIYENPELLNAK